MRHFAPSALDSPQLGAGAPSPQPGTSENGSEPAQDGKIEVFGKRFLFQRTLVPPTPYSAARARFSKIMSTHGTEPALQWLWNTAMESADSFAGLGNDMEGDTGKNKKATAGAEHAEWSGEQEREAAQEGPK